MANLKKYFESKKDRHFGNRLLTATCEEFDGVEKVFILVREWLCVKTKR